MTAQDIRRTPVHPTRLAFALAGWVLLCFAAATMGGFLPLPGRMATGLNFALWQLNR
jgi:hypothetical protein